MSKGSDRVFTFSDEVRDLDLTEPPLTGGGKTAAWRSTNDGAADRRIVNRRSAGQLTESLRQDLWSDLDRQTYRERRATADFAAHRNAAAQHFSERFYDVKPKPDTLESPGL